MMKYSNTDWNCPAEIIEGCGELAHGDKWLTPHSPPLRVNLQDVDQIDLDGEHPGLVAHVLRRDGLPAGPGSAHAPALANGLVISHLQKNVAAFFFKGRSPTCCWT